MNKEAQKHLKIVASSIHFLADYRTSKGSNLDSQHWLCRFIAKNEGSLDAEHVKKELRRLAFNCRTNFEERTKN